MPELDQVWSDMLDEAARRSADLGRLDVAEYLRLKATNDAIRTAGVEWLFATVLEIAGRAVRQRHGVTIERDEPHTFAVGSSNMAGALIRVRQSVRCLTVEAGWARLPGDGVMKKGALANARISHFGLPRHTADLRLIHGEDLPVWLNADDEPVDSAWIEQHLTVLLDA